jgi:hypothetical protein
MIRAGARGSTLFVAVVVATGGCGRVGYEPWADATIAPGDDGGARDAAVELDGALPELDAGAAGDAGPCVWGPFGDLDHLTALSSSDDELSPSITADGLLLYFARGTFFVTDQTIWVAERTDASLAFGTPRAVTELYSGGDGDPGVSNDGLEIFFERPAILYLSSRARRDQSFGPPEAIAGGGTDRASGPFLLDDDLTLFLSGNEGTTRNDWIEIWARPDRISAFALQRVVTELDTADGEGWPTLSSDGLEMFFVVDGASGVAIYRTTRATAAVAATFAPGALVPELDIGTISGDPELSTDGTTIYFASDAVGTLGGTDLWSATRTCAR